MLVAQAVSHLQMKEWAHLKEEFQNKVKPKKMEIKKVMAFQKLVVNFLDISCLWDFFRVFLYF